MEPGGLWAAATQIAAYRLILRPWNTWLALYPRDSLAAGAEVPPPGQASPDSRWPTTFARRPKRTIAAGAGERGVPEAG